MKKKTNNLILLVNENIKYTERLHKAFAEMIDRLKTANNRITKLQEKLKKTKPTTEEVE